MMLHERLLGYAEEASIEGGYPAISMAIEEELCSGSSRDIEIKIFTAIAEEIERDYIPKSDHEKALNAMVEAQSGVNEPGYRSAHYVMQAYAKYKGMPFENGDCITDWLGRWFVPRPRYEDGEPVRFGDDGIDWGDSSSYSANAITFEGQALALGTQRIHARAKMTDDGLVKRKPPKVLDADGVSINIGDTVWPIESPAMQMTVESSQTICGQETTVNCVSEGEIYTFNASELAHRFPDSLEKLRDDVRDFLDCSIKDDVKSSAYMVEVKDRLTALIERGA